LRGSTGRDVGVSKDSHLAAEFDVTDVVHAQVNTVSLRVVKWSDASYIEDQDQWWHGGIPVPCSSMPLPEFISPTCGSTPAWRTTCGTGRLELIADIEFDGEGAEPGWAIEAKLGDLGPLTAIVPVGEQGPGPEGKPR